VVGSFSIFKERFFRMAFLQKSDAFKVGKAGEKLGLWGWLFNDLLRASF
jgi:hypothetical protein